MSTRLGEPCYAVTAKGACVVESMRGNILPSVLEDSVVCAMRYLDFKHRGQAVLPDRTVPEGDAISSARSPSRDKTVLSVTLWVEDEQTARRMEDQFRAHPENTYRGVRALLTGNVNYLFDH